MEMGRTHRPTLPEGEATSALARKYIALAARVYQRQVKAKQFIEAFALPGLTTHELKQRGLYQKEILMTRIAHLERAFPSAPKVPPKYVVAVTRQQNYNTEAFVALYAAHVFVLAVINDRPFKWLNSNEIKIDDTLIKCEQGLEDIIEHKLTASEREWELPEPYASRAHFLATGERHAVVMPAQADVKAQRASNRAVGLKRQDREGMTTIQDICASLKVEPRIARGILRKTSTPKPDAGWAWSAAEAKKIEALIRKEIK